MIDLEYFIPVMIVLAGGEGKNGYLSLPLNRPTDNFYVKEGKKKRRSEGNRFTRTRSHRILLLCELVKILRKNYIFSVSFNSCVSFNFKTRKFDEWHGER